MIKLIFALLFSSLTVTYAHADAAADAARIKAALVKNNPQLEKAEKITKSNILGLYEVVMQGQLLYTDKDGRYLFNGIIYNMENMRNLTEDRSRELFKVEFDKLPFDLAIKKVKGNGKRKMAYFSDPNCGYCQKLEVELKDLDNVTLHLFLLSIFPGSAEKVKGVLCSKNPAKAWDNLMLNHTQPATGTCDAPIEKLMQLSSKLNVNGTPALIFADGILVSGYMPVAEIEQALNSGGKASN